MRILFIDTAGMDYDVATPNHKPLGGSESALCYLSVELAKRGHDVTIFTGIKQPTIVEGVKCESFEQTPREFFAQPADAIVVVRGPAVAAQTIRQQIPVAAPLILWTGHSYDQAAVTGLADQECRSAWDAIACVSNWQRDRFLETFSLDPNKTHVLRNAIAPPFENMYATREEFHQAKAGTLKLTYTSTPFRGLNFLIALFPLVRNVIPDAWLEIYSGMQVYLFENSSDRYQNLYDQCRSTPNVTYAGSVTQPELAQRLRSIQVLAYSNIFEETSCIAVMEAMAAGLCIVTSDLGALRETTQGFAELVAPYITNDPPDDYAIRFAETLVKVAAIRRDRPDNFYDHLWNQVCKTNAECTWAVRAQEWEHCIAQLATRS